MAPITHPQIEAIGGLRPVGETGDGVPVKASIAPVSLSASPAMIDAPAPKAGAHTDELLQKAGYSAAEIEQLRARKLI